MTTGRLIRAIYGHKTAASSDTLQECGCVDSNDNTPPNVTSITVIDPARAVPSEESLQAGLFPGMSSSSATLGSDASEVSSPEVATPSDIISGLASMTADLASAEIPPDAPDEDVHDKLASATALLESVLKYLKVR